MKVRFRFLTGDVNWSQYGGAWISQKFNNKKFDNDGTNYWLVREIINWEEQGEVHPNGKYTVALLTIRPEDYSQESRDQALRSIFDDEANWSDYSEEQRIEALYQRGDYIKEEEWTGNNYSFLFKECQKFADGRVFSNRAMRTVDFSKLPENLLVVVQKNRFGHLEVAPKSNRHDHNIAATNVDEQTIFYIQQEQSVERFIADYVPSSKRKELDDGWNVIIRLPLSYYLDFLSAPTYEYSLYIEEKELKERSHPTSLPNLFTEINGIPIYHVHKEGYGIGRETDFWYSTAQSPEELHYRDRRKTPVFQAGDIRRVNGGTELTNKCLCV